VVEEGLSEEEAFDLRTISQSLGPPDEGDRRRGRGQARVAARS
jgi:hypothetical protein